MSSYSEGRRWCEPREPGEPPTLKRTLEYKPGDVVYVPFEVQSVTCHMSGPDRLRLKLLSDKWRLMAGSDELYADEDAVIRPPGIPEIIT